jgi:hypothetical protein
MRLPEAETRLVFSEHTINVDATSPGPILGEIKLANKVLGVGDHHPRAAFDFQKRFSDCRSSAEDFGQIFGVCTLWTAGHVGYAVVSVASVRALSLAA